MTAVIIGFLVFISSLILTKYIHYLFLHHDVLDIPNQRSMHETPIPRGGGIVIVVFTLMMSVTLYLWHMINLTELITFSLPLLITMIVALLDDTFTLSIKIRAFFYTLSAILFLFYLQPDWHFVMFFLAVISIVWMVNLYNFMDGIDGIASVEAITASAFALFIFYQIEAHELFYLTLVFLSATAGFLVWNWSPAKIFLGDVGSCSIGLIFSILAIWSYTKYQIPIEIWLVLLSAFIADASFTLVSRVLTGKNWFQAHKEHAYQKLISSGFSHKSVNIYVILFNVFITWPLAYWIYLYRHHSVIVVLLNYAILLIFWYKIQNAKQPELT